MAPEATASETKSEKLSPKYISNILVKIKNVRKDYGGGIFSKRKNLNTTLNKVEKALEAVKNMIKPSKINASFGDNLHKCLDNLDSLVKDDGVIQKSIKNYDDKSKKSTETRERRKIFANIVEELGDIKKSILYVLEKGDDIVDAADDLVDLLE